MKTNRRETVLFAIELFENSHLNLLAKRNCGCGSLLSLWNGKNHGFEISTILVLHRCEASGIGSPVAWATRANFLR
jgi:hypothetical protein